MKAIRFYKTITGPIAQLPELEAFQGRRVEFVVLDADPATTTSAVAPRPRREPGSLKGQIWMAPDFDEPLEDFKEYME